MRKKGIVFCLFLLLFPLFCLADIPAPYLRMDFDNGFKADGSASEKLKVFSGSEFPGIKKVPAGEFVEGITGKGFIPKEDLTIEGSGIFPAPEGTISLWIKPVNYEADWIGGELLFPGKIGPFLTGIMKDEKGEAKFSLQVRLYRHDCCSGLHWVEYWGWPAQTFATTGPGVPFAVWQKDRWRLLTVVWKKGDRRIYMDGVLIQHGTSEEGNVDDYIAPAAESNNYTDNMGRGTSKVTRTPSIPSDILIIPAGSKVVDELMVWDRPLSDGEVASLFYSKMPQSGLSGSSQIIPELSKEYKAGAVDWNECVRNDVWVDSYSGMVVETKPYSKSPDTLEMGHRDGYLYLRYREPMPDNYIPVKTLLGGRVLKRTTTDRDSNIWNDDSVEVRISPDGGKTNYILGVSASGALYDSLNGNTDFNLSDNDWTVIQKEDDNYWTVEMKINIKALSSGKVPSELGFNFIRTVQQQGYRRYQWSYSPNSPYGILKLSGSKESVMPSINWTSVAGTLKVKVEGISSAGVKVHYKIQPLNFFELFPEEGRIDARYGIFDVFRATRRLENIPPATEKTEDIPSGSIRWEGVLQYSGEWAALAEVVVTDSSGKEVARKASLITSRRDITARTFSLPSRRQLVAQIFLPSERIIGNDVIADIKVIPEGKTEPVITKKMEGFKNIMEEAVMDTSGIAVGSYRVEISVKKGDTLLGMVSNRWFKSGDPKWLNNEIGIIKAVPAPWTPVEHRRDTGSLKVWGREYSFKNSLLPSSLKVLGEEILSGPVRLIVETESGIIDTSKTKTPAIVVDSAGIISDMKGSIAGENLIIEVEGEIEFDGFGYFTFRFKPVDSSVDIKSIVLEVPVKKQYAQLYDDANYNMFNTRSGSIPSEGMALPAQRSIRIGDTTRGIQIHPLPSPLGNITTKTPLTITPSGNTILLRYVISEGIKIDRPIENTLGFICTPVKPFDGKRMRKTGHAGPPVKDPELRDKGYASAQYWTAGWTGYAGGEGSEDGYYHFTETWCEGLAKLWKKRWETERIYPCLYVVPGLITSHTPEYAIFWKEWNGQYIEGLEDIMRDLSSYDGAEKRPAGRWMDVDFTKKSYQDFYFYCLDRVLAAFEKEGVRAGVYVDCPPTSTGEIIKPYRQWVQRLYQVVRKHSPDGLIVIHMSGDRTMAVWGMVDSLVEGEQYTANWQAYMVSNPGLTMNDCYPKVLPMDRVRASYAGSLWGPQEVFLSQFWTDLSQKEDVYRKENQRKQPPSYIKRFRYITGLMLLHDASFWGEFYACGVKGDPQSPWFKRAKWGYDESVQFIPYWNTKGMIELEAPEKQEIVASGWFRPDGELMVILFNNSEKNTTVKLKINPDRFPVKLKNFTLMEDITSPVEVFAPDATEPDVYKYKNGSAEIEMRPRDFRLLVCK